MNTLLKGLGALALIPYALTGTITLTLLLAFLTYTLAPWLHALFVVVVLVLLARWVHRKNKPEPEPEPEIETEPEYEYPHLWTR